MKRKTYDRIGRVPLLGKAIQLALVDPTIFCSPMKEHISKHPDHPLAKYLREHPDDIPTRSDLKNF